jgi:hypothetical protein
MNKDSNKDELRPEYDLSKLKGKVRGKYSERYKQGTNVILLEPDVASVFPNSEAVNEALRKLISENALSK